MTMRQESSTVTTSFINEVDGIVYGYTVTQQSGKPPHLIGFSASRDGTVLVKGFDRPLENGFYFETVSPVASRERGVINDRVNLDLEGLRGLSCGINLEKGG